MRKELERAIVTATDLYRPKRAKRPATDVCFGWAEPSMAEPHMQSENGVNDPFLTPSSPPSRPARDSFTRSSSARATVLKTNSDCADVVNNRTPCARTCVASSRTRRGTKAKLYGLKEANDAYQYSSLSALLLVNRMCQSTRTSRTWSTTICTHVEDSVHYQRVRIEARGVANVQNTGVEHFGTAGTVAIGSNRCPRTKQY